MNEIELARAEYAKLKKIEEYTATRPLNRPNVKKWQVVVAFAAIPAVIFVAVLPPLLLSATWQAFSISAIALFLAIEGYVRVCLILLVKCYQRYAKVETRRRCKCVPSCSEYAVLSLKKIFPLFVALLKIRKRLFSTCDGREYRIDFPTKKTGEEFEKRFL